MVESVRFSSELLRAIFLLKRLDQLVEIAVHHVRQLVKREVDAMVRHTSLRKVVRANALRPVTASDLKLSRLRLRRLLFLLLSREQSRLQQRHRARAILVLRALVLTFDDDARREVRDAHR